MSEKPIKQYSIEPFTGLPQEAAAALLRRGMELEFPEGEWIYRQGANDEEIYLLVSGSVEGILLSESGVPTTVFNWESGDLFGEECLFVAGARRESARTTAPSKLFRIGRQDFEEAQTEFPALSAFLSRALFQHISRIHEHLHHSAEMEQAYLKFLSAHGGGNHWRPLGRSESLRRVREAAEAAGGNRNPVLLVGPAGTEKQDVARSIHAGGARPNAPFLVMDAKTVGLELILGTSGEDVGEMARELAQDLALFGCRIGIPTAADVDRMGYLRVGSGGTVLIENVECLSVVVQERLYNFLRTGSLLPMGADFPIRSNARIMVSTTVDLAAWAEAGKFHPGLLSCFQKPYLQLPALIKRKKDILPMAEGLAREFARRTGKKIEGIHPAAVVELLEYSWPGNTEELAATIRCAVDLAQGPELMPEDVFVSGKPAFSGPTLNILPWKNVGGLIRHRWFPAALQWPAGIAIALIMALGFWGNPSPEHNVALILAWSLWEPAVFWGALFFGRVWCAICPIGGLNSAISERFSLQRRIPPWLRKYGLHLGAAGLAVILWLEEASAMPSSAWATAWLVLSILLGGILFAVVYARRAWCRYVCPFGGMVGLFSSCAALEIRSNKGVCDNECKTHACFKGGKSGGGCPLLEGPFMLQTNIHCVMCGQCIKNCPHGALRLNLRLPAAELWTSAQPAAAIAIYLPVVIASQVFRQTWATGVFRPLEEPAVLRWSFLAFFFLLLIAAASWWMQSCGRSLFGGEEETSPNAWGFFAHALLPLSLAFELGFQTERALERAGLFPDVLLHQMGIASSASLGAPAIPWVVQLIQVGLCFLGILASNSLLKKLLSEKRDPCRQQKYPMAGVWSLGLLYVVLLIFG